MVYLTHTGAQLDAAIAASTGGGSIGQASGTIETTIVDSFALTGLSFTPKVLLWSFAVEGTPHIFTTEYIEETWLTSFVMDGSLIWHNSAMSSFISASSGSITVNVPDSLPVGTEISYSVWG